jgi:hypothetical protein
MTSCCLIRFSPQFEDGWKQSITFRLWRRSIEGQCCAANAESGTRRFRVKLRARNRQAGFAVHTGQSLDQAAPVRFVP